MNSSSEGDFSIICPSSELILSLPVVWHCQAHKHSLYWWPDPWDLPSVICVVIRPFPSMKYEYISNQTHEAGTYILATVNYFCWVGEGKALSLSSFEAETSLLVFTLESKMGTFLMMALSIMPAVLSSLQAIDFCFCLLLWVLYSFLVYGDFLYLDLSNMKCFLLILWFGIKKRRESIIFKLLFLQEWKNVLKWWQRMETMGKITVISMTLILYLKLSSVYISLLF